MTIAESVLPEFDQEMGNTRKIIACVPGGKPEWRPHPKSMPLGYLTVHLSMLPNFVNRILESDELDIGLMMKSGWKLPDFESTEASTAVFDETVKQARAAIASTSDSDFMKPWTLKNNGVVFFSMPKLASLRSMVFSHIIHHRGQMTVYLRLNEIPLPGLYGPTADEPI